MKKIISVLCLCSLLLVWGCEKTCTCTTVKEASENTGNPDNPDNPDLPGATNTEKLCIPQGWILSSAICSPAISQPDGSYVGDMVTEGYLSNYELDDYIKFLPNGTQIINGGTQVPGSNALYQSQDYFYAWSFNSDETVLNMQVPFLYSNDIEHLDLIELNSDRLVVAYTFNAWDYCSQTSYSCTATLTYIPRNVKAGNSAKSSVQSFSKTENTVKTKGKCSDLNAETNTVNSDGTRYHEKTECK